MQRFKHRFLLWSFIIALAVVAVQSTGVDAATPKPHPHKTPPTPAVSALVVSTLFGIAGVSSDNIWAVGTAMNVPQFTGQPLIEHWNGSNWQITPAPATPQNELNSLIGISAIAQNDVWAVGFSMAPTSSTGQPLIEHWNGTNWQIIPAPTTIGASGLSAISASGPDDIWAVGSSYSTSASGVHSQALTLHWDGSSWQVVPAASTENSSLLSVTSINAQDAWAVGSSFSAKESKNLIEHWNGTNWQSLPAPPSTMRFNRLSSVAAISDHDLWVIGNSSTQPAQIHPSIDHWDGSSWQVMSTSGLPTSFIPNTISATSTDTVWIAGNQAIAHWNGKSWQSFPITSPQGFNSLLAILALSSENIWTVGFNIHTESSAPLIAHWHNSTWQTVEPGAAKTPLHPTNHPG